VAEFVIGIVVNVLGHVAIQDLKSVRVLGLRHPIGYRLI
jgi:hypothetical protein